MNVFYLRFLKFSIIYLFLFIYIFSPARAIENRNGAIVF